MRVSARLIAVILLTLVVLAWFWPVALGRLPSGGDATARHLPQMLKYDEALEAGRMPIWNDQVAFGEPLHAQGEVGLYYPLHLFLHSLLPGRTAYGMSLLLHMLLATWFAYLCARWFQLGRPASMLAAIVFAGQGFFINHLEHPWSYTTGCWIPLAVGLTWRWLEDGGWRWLVLLIGTLAVQLLAGHFQLAFYTQLFLLVMGIVTTASAGKERGRLGLRTAAIPLAIIGSLLLAAIQLLPTSELLAVADLRGRGLEWLGSFATAPIHLVNYLVPTLMQDHPLWQGVVWESWHTSPRECLHYAGLLPLGLAVRSLLPGIRDRRVCICAVMWAITVLLMLGPYLPGFSLLAKLPPLGWFTATARWSLFGGLMLGIMAGISLEQVELASFQRWLLKYAAVVAFVTALLVAMLAFASGSMESFGKPLNPVAAHDLLEHGYTMEQGQSAGLTPYRELPAMLKSELGVPVVNLLLLLLLAAGVSRMRGKKAMVIASLAVVVLDLGMVAQQLRRVDLDSHVPDPPGNSLMERLEGLTGERVITPMGELATLTGAVPVKRPSIPDMAIYWDPFLGPDIVNIWGTSFPTIPTPRRWQDLATDAGFLASNLNRDQLELMRLSGIRYLALGPYSLQPNPDLPLLYRETISEMQITSDLYGNYMEQMPATGRQWNFWELSAELSVARAWAFPITDPAQPGSDPRLQMVPPPARRQMLDSAVPASEIEGKGERFTVRGSVPSRSILVLADLDYPGWTATLLSNGQERELAIEPAFGGWRAVELSVAGKYEVRFEYRPRSLRVGRRISLLALLGWITCLALCWFMDRRAITDEKPDETT
jgi:hypothetical protein